MSLVIVAVPAWAWATLLMTVFVAVSIATMWCTRYVLKEPPRSQVPDADAGDEEVPSEGR